MSTMKFSQPKRERTHGCAWCFPTFQENWLPNNLKIDRRIVEELLIRETFLKLLKPLDGPTAVLFQFLLQLPSHQQHHIHRHKLPLQQVPLRPHLQARLRIPIQLPLHLHPRPAYPPPDGPFTSFNLEILFQTSACGIPILVPQSLVCKKPTANPRLISGQGKACMCPERRHLQGLRDMSLRIQIATLCRMLENKDCRK